ncbi:MAG: DegT/DnrJ/EryC1/StrS family aminotransferase [Candidatus Rokubacteria bacterium]|nr:DegT/DnrJ/EryC1/StrS family aminotransferase [Candidatus Rokubacteria bacterium]
MAGFDRETLRLALERENIESRPLRKPMRLEPVFAQSPAYLSGVSEALFARGLRLPSGTGMSEEDLERVCTIP